MSFWESLFKTTYFVAHTTSLLLLRLLERFYLYSLLLLYIKKIYCKRFLLCLTIFFLCYVLNYKFVCFEMGALFHSPVQWVKKCTNFKINKFLQAIQSFLYCLYSSKYFFFVQWSSALYAEGPGFELMVHRTCLKHNLSKNVSLQGTSFFVTNANSNDWISLYDTIQIKMKDVIIIIYSFTSWYEYSSNFNVQSEFSEHFNFDYNFWTNKNNTFKLTW